MSVWRRDAADVLDRIALEAPRRDIVVACNGLGYVQGLDIAQLADLPDRRTLDVPIFIIVSAGDERGVHDELVDHLGARAAGYGCSALRIWAQTADNWLQHLTPGAAHEAPIDLSIPVTRS